jgi:hypothetical protein
MTVLLAGVSFVPSCGSALVAPAYDSAQVDRGWTLLIYYSVDYVSDGIGDRDQDRDRDSDGGQDSDHVGDDLNAHPYSTPEDTLAVELAALTEATSLGSDDVNVLVLVDKLTEDGISLFEIADGAMIPLTTWEEQNTADPAVLEAFVTLGLDRYPNSTTALFITGEGHAWRGICRDRDPDDPNAADDLMSVDQIADVLVSSATEDAAVDLLVFNGANMASIEVAYELRDAVPYMVATQSQIQEDGIPYGVFVADLIESPDMSVAEFATTIVDAHVEYYAGGKTGTGSNGQTSSRTEPRERDPDADRAYRHSRGSDEIDDSAFEADDGDGSTSGEGREQLSHGEGQIAQDFANMSAFDMSRIADVVAAHSEFATLLAALMQDLHNVIPAARDASMVGHHNDISDYDYLSDIYTFISVLGDLLDETRNQEYPELRSAMDAYQSVYAEALVAEAHADKFHNTNGLSIWYPGSLTSYELKDSGNAELKFGQTFFYEDPALGLDFVTDSSWVDYLYAYYLAVGGHGSE